MPMPRRMSTRGPISPLSIALASIGDGMQEYGKVRDRREAIGRLDSAEQYRRKMERQKLERQEAMTAAEKAAERKERANRARNVAGIRPDAIGRNFTPAEAEAIVAGDINPSDLAPPRAATTPATRPATAGQEG